MKVLIDTNIMLDGILEREPFVSDALALFEAIELERVQGFVTATTLTNIFYIVRKQTKSIDKAREAVIQTLELMEVSAVNRLILQAALASNLRDFEDAVQLACALGDRLDAIITRDPHDFADSSLPILSVRELLNQINYP